VSVRPAAQCHCVPVNSDVRPQGTHVSRTRLVIEAVAVVVSGVLLSAALYSDWFKECCMTESRDLLGLVTLPAILFASLIGGRVHAAKTTHFTIGLVIELLLLWGVLLRVRHIWGRRRSSRA
jgi:hypothetical protein